MALHSLNGMSVAKQTQKVVAEVIERIPGFKKGVKVFHFSRANGLQKVSDNRQSSKIINTY